MKISSTHPNSSLTFPWQHATRHKVSLRRARRERLLLYILRASLRTIPQDVLLSSACTDAALTSTVQQHTHTHKHSVHPLLHIPPTPAQPLLASFPRCFNPLVCYTLALLEFRDENIRMWGIPLEYFNKNLIDRRRKSSNSCHVVLLWRRVFKWS